MIVTEYAIIQQWVEFNETNEAVSALEKKVTARLSSGWVCVGGITVVGNGNTLLQAMTKMSNTDELKLLNG